MPIFELNKGNGLLHYYTPPSIPQGKTFVFFNALTGDTNMWEGHIGEQLRKSGHGTLSFNYRGQSQSPFSSEIALDARLIVDDACRLLAHIHPNNTVLCGLSIGGLFAAQTWLACVPNITIDGLVLINTLRRDGPRLRWISDALVRCVEVGGLELFRDLYVPLLFNEDWQAQNRSNFLQLDAYTPLSRDSGHYNLLSHADSVDWDLPYENLTLPTLVITGLQDRVFLDQDDVNQLYARLPNAQRLDMADAGHLLPAERPQALLETLLQFVKGI